MAPFHEVGEGSSPRRFRWRLGQSSIPSPLVIAPESEEECDMGTRKGGKQRGKAGSGSRTKRRSSPGENVWRTVPPEPCSTVTLLVAALEITMVRDPLKGVAQETERAQRT